MGATLEGGEGLGERAVLCSTITGVKPVVPRNVLVFYK